MGIKTVAVYSDADRNALHVFSGQSGFEFRTGSDHVMIRVEDADAHRERAHVHAACCASIDDRAATDKGMMGIKLVLNCAGPFMQTAVPIAPIKFPR